MMYDEEIIFDTPQLRHGKQWSHIAAKSTYELRRYAKIIGLRVEWFQDKPGRPHFDVYSNKMRKYLLHLGAKQVERSYLLNYLKFHYGTETEKTEAIECEKNKNVECSG